MDEIRKKIENNVRFIITISVFFLALIPEIRFEGCVLIVFHIINYIVFELMEKKYTTTNLQWINWSLLAGIGVYVFPLTSLALSTQNYILPTWAYSLWLESIKVSTWLVMLLPGMSMVLIVLLPLYNSQLQKIYRVLIKLRYHRRNVKK